jgi:hypothetical protein
MKNLMILIVTLAACFASANHEPPATLPIGSELLLKLDAISQITLVHSQIWVASQSGSVEGGYRSDDVVTEAKVSEVLQHIANFRPTVTYFGDVPPLGVHFHCENVQGHQLFRSRYKGPVTFDTLDVRLALVDDVPVYVGQDAKKAKIIDKDRNTQYLEVSDGYIQFPKSSAGLTDLVLMDQNYQLIAYYGKNGDSLPEFEVKGPSVTASFDGVYPVRQNGGFVYLNGVSASKGSWIVLEVTSDGEYDDTLVRITYPDGTSPEKIYLYRKHFDGYGDEVEVLSNGGYFPINTPAGELWHAIVPNVSSAPIVVLNGDSRVYLPIGSEFVEPGFTALDTEDGNITDQVYVTNYVDMHRYGTYKVVYTVTDSSGISHEVIRTVVVYDPDAKG